MNSSLPTVIRRGWRNHGRYIYATDARKKKETLLFFFTSAATHLIISRAFTRGTRTLLSFKASASCLQRHVVRQLSIVHLIALRHATICHARRTATLFLKQ